MPPATTREPPPSFLSGATSGDTRIERDFELTPTSSSSATLGRPQLPSDQAPHPPPAVVGASASDDAASHDDLASTEEDNDGQSDSLWSSRFSFSGESVRLGKFAHPAGRDFKNWTPEPEARSTASVNAAWTLESLKQRVVSMKEVDEDS